MRKFIRQCWFEIVVVAIFATAIILLAFGATGCSADGGFSVGEARAKAAEVSSGAHAAIDGEKARWQAEYQAAQVAGDDEAAAKAKASLDLLNQWDAEVAKGEALANQTLDKITDAEGNLDPVKAAGQGAVLLPFPYNVIAGMAIPGIGLLIREFQNARRIRDAKAATAASNQMATEIVAAIDAARKLSPAIGDAMSTDAVKTAMWERMSVPTYEFVDRARNT